MISGKLCGLPLDQHCAVITLHLSTVTGTENRTMAAVLAQGTRIHTAAREPKVVCLAGVLNSMGARIIEAGTYATEIAGVSSPASVHGHARSH
jgi:UDP-N-acetylglucosamine 1-carboxyvinyltransferase